MRKRFYIAAVLLTVAVCAVLLSPKHFPGWDAPNILTAAQNRAIQQDLFRAVELCSGAGSTEKREAVLKDAGFSVVITDPVYPDYLANAQPLREFAQADQADAAVLQVNEDGSFFHLFFSKGKENVLVLTKVSAESDVQELDILPLYETELSEWDIFYYRCYPKEDPHYIDYSFFRLSPVDQELYDLTLKYILPVGYRMVNIFLRDWQEGNWDAFSIEDTFEYLYELQTGTAFPWQDYPATELGNIHIPDELFENTIQSYFAILQKELRAVAQYDSSTDSYLWKPIHGDDLTAWELPIFQPEVIQCCENTDGTLVLTVQVGCPERKTNALFTHDVTIRPYNEGFQYVGNQIIHVSTWGLPPDLSRFQLDGNRKQYS